MTTKLVLDLVKQIRETTDPQTLRDLRKRLIEAVSLTPKR